MRDYGAATALVGLLVGISGCVSGCNGGGRAVQFSGTQTNMASASLVISAKDAPRPGVSILSLQVTVTGARLEPGNIALVNAPVMLELTRLAADSSLLGISNVPAGTYTGVTLTFANPTVTFKNDSGRTIIVGSASCASRLVCTASPAVAALNGTVNFGAPGIVVAANQPVSLSLNLDMRSLLSTTLQVDLFAGTTITQLTPAAQGTAIAAATAVEDVTGVVGAKDAVNNRFTLHTALGDYGISVNTGTSGTAFLNFPATACSASGFACIATDEIVSVNMNLQSDNSLVATQVFFEDANATQPEIEGTVIATTGLTAPVQFSFVVLLDTPAGSGPAIGALVTVAAQSASFDVDNLGASVATTSFSFAGVQDVLVGQQVQVRRGIGSTSTQINASRVRLRSSRITATVSTVAVPMLTLANIDTLPSSLTAAGISEVQVFTLPPPNVNAFTEIGGSASNITQILVGDTLTVRGQMFKNGNTNSGGASTALVATRVVRQ